MSLPQKQDLDSQFAEAILAFNYNNHPLLVPPKLIPSNVHLIDPNIVRDFFRQAFCNPKEFTFTLVAPFEDFDKVPLLFLVCLST